MTETIDFSAVTDELIDERLQWHADRNYTYCLNIEATPNNVRLALEMFRCQQCGWCCQNLNGVVLVNDEIHKTADAAGISAKELKRRCHRQENRHLMKTPCTFQDAKTKLCTIYESRPKVCKLYPLQNPQTYTIDGQQTPPLLCVDPRCPGARKLAHDIFHYIKSVAGRVEKP